MTFTAKTAVVFIYIAVCVIVTILVICSPALLPYDHSPERAIQVAKDHGFSNVVLYDEAWLFVYSRDCPNQSYRYKAIARGQKGQEEDIVICINFFFASPLVGILR